MSNQTHRTPGRLAAMIRGAVGWGLLWWGMVGCVRTYQPLEGLHDPRVVDPSMTNFPEVRLDIYCVPNKELKAAQAAILCQRVGVLFENQGAAVETFIQDPSQQAGDAGLGGSDDATTRPADLIVELRAETVKHGFNTISYALAWSTLSILPAVRETTFSQTVVVRDGSGFLLADAHFRGRLVERFGAGTWVGNWILDKLTREPEERITGEAAANDLSADLYGQLSQVVFNAKLRREALGLQAPVVTGRSP